MSSYGGPVHRRRGIWTPVRRSVVTVSPTHAHSRTSELTLLTLIVDEQNGVFSRVKQCSDKSWCCSEKTGSDVAADIAVCCANGQGVFLNSKGVIVDDTTSTSTPTSTTSLTTIVSPISSHSPSTTASSTVTSDDSGRSSHGNLSTGAKAGIGVGAAVAGIFLLAALAALWTKLHNRRRAVDYTKRHSEVAFTMQDQEPLSSSGNGGSLPQPCGGLERKDRVPREPPELQAYAPI